MKLLTPMIAVAALTVLTACEEAAMDKTMTVDGHTTMMDGEAMKSDGDAMMDKAGDTMDASM